MKLQFNTRGAWKDVLGLPDDADESSVKIDAIVDAASALLEACESAASFRIVDGEHVVLIVDRHGRSDHPFGRPGGRCS